MSQNSLRELLEELQEHVTEAQNCLDAIKSLTQSRNPYEGALNDYMRFYAVSHAYLSKSLPEIDVERLDLKRTDYERFLNDYLPWHSKIHAKTDHKKKLELFATFTVLGSRLTDTYLDAAGGGFSYAGTLRGKRSILQDMEIRLAVKERTGEHVQYVESSLSKIPLDDGSVDAISSHHSFEHFQGSADGDFIQEVQRILKPDGMLAMVPFFIAKDAIEMTNSETFSNWSIEEDRRILDPKATLPGKLSGNFARIYDTETLRKRILSKIDFNRFSLKLIEVTLDGRPIPDPEVYKDHKVSNFNFPYRVFVLKRII